MVRLLRVEFPGAIYHVTCRMVGDRPPRGGYGDAEWLEEKRLFRDDRDYWGFVDRLAERVDQFHVRLYLFTCMTNHFHLVYETPEANSSRFMQSLSTAYTVYHNVRHHRHGHLLDGRYKAKLVDRDAYLLALSRYVHLNPVQVGGLRDRPIEERMATPHRYRWSSYSSYIGAGQVLDWVEYGPLLAQMPGRKRERPARYREFVESGLAETDDAFTAALNRSRHSIGSDDFRAGIANLYQERVASCVRPEDVSFRRMSEPLSVEAVLASVTDAFGVETADLRRRQRSSPLRGVAGRCLIRYAGLSQRDAAHVLEMGSGAALSNQLARLPGKLAGDPRLRRRLEQLEKGLHRAWSRQSRLMGGAG